MGGGDEALPLFAIVGEDFYREDQCVGAIGDGDSGDGIVAVVSVRDGIFDLEEESFDGEVGVVVALYACFV